MGGLSAHVSRFDKGGQAAHGTLPVTYPLHRYRVLRYDADSYGRRLTS